MPYLYKCKTIEVGGRFHFGHENSELLKKFILEILLRNQETYHLWLKMISNDECNIK